jgi:hypothetical protein
MVGPWEVRPPTESRDGGHGSMKIMGAGFRNRQEHDKDRGFLKIVQLTLIRGMRSLP